jgi:hypothetical protein
VVYVKLCKRVWWKFSVTRAWPLCWLRMKCCPNYSPGDLSKITENRRMASLGGGDLNPISIKHGHSTMKLGHTESRLKIACVTVKRVLNIGLSS